MALVERTIVAPPDAVWAALTDPTTYPGWLIGARRIRSVDEGWPAPGTAFHHTVGVWPLLVHDRSIVREIDGGVRLVMEVRASPAVRAVVRFELHHAPDGRSTRLELEEEPSYRIVGNLLRPLLDPLTHLRNQRSLQRLEAIIAGRAQAPEGP